MAANTSFSRKRMNMARGVYTPFEERFDWKEKGQQHPVPIPPVGETDPNEDGRTPLSDQKGSVSAKHDPVRYYKIPMETLRVDTITGFDLYLRIHEDGETSPRNSYPDCRPQGL